MRTLQLTVTYTAVVLDEFTPERAEEVIRKGEGLPPLKEILKLEIKEVSL